MPNQGKAAYSISLTLKQYVNVIGVAAVFCVT